MSKLLTLSNPTKKKKKKLMLVVCMYDLIPQAQGHSTGEMR